MRNSKNIDKYINIPLEVPESLITIIFTGIKLVIQYVHDKVISNCMYNQKYVFTLCEL